MKALPIITLDGPAGVGKSTLAKQVATVLNMPYLDTGAMFRTVALRLGPGAEHLPHPDLLARCMGFSFRLEGTGADTVLLCNDVPTGKEIRREEVGQLASSLATVAVVRDYLKEAQRILGESTPLVVEGRDMGTVVFPNARFKFFLDARIEVRAMRRFKELEAKGEKPDLEAITTSIRTRDEKDRNRPIAPLKPAEDAKIIDTSELDIEGVLDVILETVRRPATAILEAIRCPGPTPKKDVSSIAPKLVSGKDHGQKTFSHLREDGALQMVDVGKKTPSERIARARGVVELCAETLRLLKAKALPKGDVLVTAQIAGIMAAKRTSELIPLCHQVPLTSVDVQLTVRDNPPAVLIEAEVRTMDRTGVEMEAILAVQTAAATLYDMCKAVQRDIVIRDVRLIHKSGGRSGTFDAGEARDDLSSH